MQDLCITDCQFIRLIDSFELILQQDLISAGSKHDLVGEVT